MLLPARGCRGFAPAEDVLIAAFRRDHQHHAVALQWLDGARVACAEGRASLALLPMVTVGFLRLVTNRRVFIEPDSIEDAVAFVEALLDSPGVELNRAARDGQFSERNSSLVVIKGTRLPMRGSPRRPNPVRSISSPLTVIS